MDNPDIADIVVTCISDAWPHCSVKKIAIPEYGGDVFAIEVNRTVVGITSGLSFATWNFEKHRATIVGPHDKDFFDVVRYWTQIKAHLNAPRTLAP